MLIPRLLDTRKISKSFRKHRIVLLRTKKLLAFNLARKRLSSRHREMIMNVSSKKRRKNGKSSKRSSKIKLLSFKVRRL